MADNTEVQDTEVQVERSAPERMSIRDALQQQFEKPEDTQNEAEPEAEAQEENQEVQDELYRKAMEMSEGNIDDDIF